MGKIENEIWYQSVDTKQELGREILFRAKRGENFKILRFHFARSEETTFFNFNFNFNFDFNLTSL